MGYVDFQMRQLQDQLYLYWKHLRKYSKWVDDPSAAMWMATISKRMVLSQNKMTSKSFFIGKNIQSLLRWKMNSCNHQLSWQLAA